MVAVTYVGHDGKRRTVDVPNGESVMRGAINHMVDGIVGECGGGLACATCHCYVDEAWVDRVGPPSEIEAQMLEAAACERKTSSRLSCQIVAGDALDGLVVHLPETQF